MNQESHQDVLRSEHTGPLARVIRLTWRILGNFLLFILLILIVIGSQSQASLLNVVFWLTVAGLVLIRFIDIQAFHGQTADNKPATMKDWLNYAAGTVAMSGFFWILVQAIRNRLH